MKIKIVISILILSLFISSAFAQVGGSYGFTIDTRTDWSSTTTYDKGETGHYLPFNDTSIYNFTGYNGKFLINNIRAIQGASWWFWNDKVLTFDFMFQSANNYTNRIHVYVECRSDEREWGMVVTQYVKACIRVDTDLFDGNWGNITYDRISIIGNIAHAFLDTEDTLDLGSYFNIVLSKHNSTSLKIGVFNFQKDTDKLAPLFSVYAQVNSDFFEQVMCYLTITHDGHGNFEALSYSEAFSFNTNTTSYPTDNATLRKTGFYITIQQLFNSIAPKILPRWLIDTINGFGNWFSLVGGILLVVLSNMSAMLFIVPVIFLFYFLDVIYTSVEKRSFEPIGVFATSIYSLGVNVIGTLTTIAETIYSYIKFW